MNKKWTPHAITAGALTVFIVLGLACASTPSPISVPPLEELRKKNEGQNTLVVIFNERWDEGNVYLVTDPSLIESIREYQDKFSVENQSDDFYASYSRSLDYRLKIFGAICLDNYSGADVFGGKGSPVDTAAFSLDGGVSTILVCINAPGRGFRGGFMTINIDPAEKEQYYAVGGAVRKITDMSEVSGLLKQNKNRPNVRHYYGRPDKDSDGKSQRGYISMER